MLFERSSDGLYVAPGKQMHLTSKYMFIEPSKLHN